MSFETARRPLRWKLTGSVAALSLVLSTVWGATLVSEGRRTSLQAFEDRASAIAFVLSQSLRAAVDFDDTLAAEDSLSNLSAIDDAVHGFLVRDNGEALGSWTRPGVEGELKTPIEVEDRRIYQIAFGHEYVWVLMPVVVRDPDSGAVAKRASLKLALSLESHEAKVSSEISRALLIALLFTLLGGAIAFGLGVLFVRPIDALTEVVSRIVRTGNLTVPIDVETNDEVGVLAHSFRRMLARQQEILRALHESVTNLGHISAALGDVGGQVTNGATSIDDEVSMAEDSLARASKVADTASAVVEALAHHARSGQQTVTGVAARNQTSAERLDEMAASIDQTAMAMEAMVTSFDDVAKSVHKAHGDVEKTSGRVLAFSTALEVVNADALAAADTTDAATDVLTKGRGQVDAALLELTRIADAVETASNVIERLVDQSAAIGGVVDVINEIAEQTNMLSLNASIIAAKAGNEGHGFGVVANEIKALAARTRTSTGEIAGIIRDIQQEASTAAEAMQQGKRAVYQGTQIGTALSGAFDTVRIATDEAKNRIDSIAQATPAQTREVQRVADALSGVAASMDRINHATALHQRSSEAVLEQTARLNQLTHELRGGGRRQAQDAASLTEAIHAVTKRVEEVEAAQQKQREAALEIQRAVESIRAASALQLRVARGLDVTMDKLRAESDGLDAQAKGLIV